MTKEYVNQFIINCIGNYASENDIVIDLSEGQKARLYGGSLDSMELVALIVHIEEAIEEETGKCIVLASEKAMSQRTSPFASLGQLSDYIFELINQD
jgi:acyl carrier protein